MKAKCKIESCIKEATKKGFCEGHYRLYGNTRRCEVEGCSNPHIAKGLCRKHYSRVKRHGTLLETKEFHGFSDTRVYRTWKHMKGRCYDKNDKFYKRYGARGITVCEDWRNSFSKFYSDMGEPPTTKHQLDRIDNNKGYFPGNCRWVTNQINCQNNGNCKLTFQMAKEIKYSGISAKEEAKKYGVSVGHIHQIRSGRTWKNV